ncbi:hypothetical protein [Nocardia sp. NPDC049149]|uniref:hypothetical protein n=1 Tax=Nocardia sp. NPDC049149 TaxID=3364315 RepID=UPI0037199F67
MRWTTMRLALGAARILFAVAAVMLGLAGTAPVGAADTVDDESAASTVTIQKTATITNEKTIVTGKDVYGVAVSGTATCAAVEDEPTGSLWLFLYQRESAQSAEAPVDVACDGKSHPWSSKLQVSSAFLGLPGAEFDAESAGVRASLRQGGREVAHGTTAVKLVAGKKK